MQGRPWLKYTDRLMFCTAYKEDGATAEKKKYILWYYLAAELKSPNINKKHV
jgi:hypothetical protein